MSEFWFVLVGCVVAIHGAVRAAWSPCGQSMLASLTPIAERARRSSWRVTVTAFAIGAVAAGALGGTVLGAAGSLLPGSGWRAPVVLAVLLAALTIDGDAAAPADAADKEAGQRGLDGALPRLGVRVRVWRTARTRVHHPRRVCRDLRDVRDRAARAEALGRERRSAPSSARPRR